MMKRSIILLALLCRQLTIFSQYAVSGIVKDENNQALPGANVIIEKTFRGVVTDQNGKFSFPGIKKGNIVLKISFLGFETELRNLDVQGDLDLEIQMKRNTLVADEVVVLATRAANNTPVAQTNIRKEDLKQMNQGQDVPYLLALTPSLVTTSDAGAGVGYTSFRIRGTDLNRINITMNGIPLNDAESHGVWWVDLPDFSSSVDNVQIQRGVGTSSVGAGAFGASINFQTFSLDKVAHGEVNSAYGSFNTFKNTVSIGSGLINNHFTFDARVSKISSDGFIDRASSDLKSLHLSASYRDSKNLIRINYITGTEKTYQAWNGVPSVKLKNDSAGMVNYVNVMASWGYIQGNQADLDNIFNAAPRRYNLYTYSNQTDNYQQDNMQLLYSHEFSPTLSFNAALHYTLGQGYYEEFKANKKLADYSLPDLVLGDTTIRRTDLIRQKWMKNDFYGITYSLNYAGRKTTLNLGGALNNYYGEHFGRVIWAQYYTSDEQNKQFYYSDGNKTDLNFFGKLGYQASGSVYLFGDIQFRRIIHDMVGVDDDQRDISQKHVFNFFNPKLGISYAINTTQNVYGYWGIAQREPTRSNFVDANPAGPAPVSEKLLDYELGYNYSGSYLKINVNLYFMDYKDQLVLTGEVNDVGDAVMNNVPYSYRQGLEVSVACQPFSKLDWNGNLNLSRNKIRNYTDHIDNYDDPDYIQKEVAMGETDISFSPAMVASSQFQYHPAKFLELVLNSKYVGKQFIDNTSNSGRILNAYFLNDLKVNTRWEISKLMTMETILSVNNLFNAEYETNAWLYQYIEGNELKIIDGYFPQAGRNYMFSIILNF